MEEITIDSEEKTANGKKFIVLIGNFKYEVTFTGEYYSELTQGNISEEELVRKSFKFLLEREPKEAILSSFDLSTIETYFPEYKRVIKKLSTS